jgi:hypothetical protein
VAAQSTLLLLSHPLAEYFFIGFGCEQRHMRIDTFREPIEIPSIEMLTRFQK